MPRSNATEQLAFFGRMAHHYLNWAIRNRYNDDDYRDEERAPIDYRGRVWVTVVETQQQYGGPEEGGWYYNYCYVLETVNVPVSMAHRMIRNLPKKWMEDHHNPTRYGDGVVEVKVTVRPYRFIRPHYC